jgi:N utilization substance protein A
MTHFWLTINIKTEREVIVEDYTQRMGEVIMVTVKRIDRGNAYVDMGIST